MRTALDSRLCVLYTGKVHPPSITEQLQEALKAAGWSVQELLDRSKLPIDRSSLARKLTGDLPLKTSEAEVLAATLKVRIVFPRKGRAS